MKKSISILCATYLFGTGLATAATAIIDFGVAGSTTPTYAFAQTHNILQSAAVPISTTMDTDEEWKFASWTSRPLGASASPVFSESLWDGNQYFTDFVNSLQLASGDASSFSDIWRDGLNSMPNSGLNSGIANITFSGLVAGQTYTISLGMGRADQTNSTTAISTTSGTLLGGSWFQSDGTFGSTAFTEYQSNSANLQAIASYDITADASGKIQLSMSNSTQFAAFQFVTISDGRDNIPEPGSAALALLGFSALGFRRRRKR